MCAAGSLAAVLSRFYLTVNQDVLLVHGTVSIAANGVFAISVAVVAIVDIVSIAAVAVGNSVVYQGAVLILTELADQLRFQS